MLRVVRRSRAVRVSSVCGQCRESGGMSAAGGGPAMISTMTPSGVAGGGPESAGAPQQYPPPPVPPGYEYYPDYRYMEYPAICEVYGTEYGEYSSPRCRPDPTRRPA